MPFSLRVAAFVLLSAALVFAVNPGHAFEHMMRADPTALAVALAVSCLGVVVSGMKWRGLLRARRIEMPLVETVRLYWIGMFFSNFLPTSVGGDAVRLSLARHRGSVHELAASILVERLTGLAMLLGVLAAGLAVHATFAGSFAVPDSVWVLVLITAVGIVLALLLPRPMRRLTARVRRRLPSRLGPATIMAERVLHALRAYGANPRALLSAVGMSLPFYITIVLSHAACLAAVGAHVTPLQLLVVAPLVSLVSVIPIVPNGAGLTEGAFVLLYAGVGVPPDVALAAALLRRLVDLVNSAIGGGIWALRRKPILRPA